ncbi:hypothetical protein [Halobacteriovorax sp.]|uniref:hypothetical protein n=1 Tax=Halobacteriovorax sp. TaxID=2020862 RepID=UPI0035683927
MSKFISILFILAFLFPTNSFSKEKVRIAFTDLVHATAHFYIDEIVQIYKNIGTEPVVSIYPDQRVTYLFELGKIDALGEEVGIYESQNPSAVKINVPILESLPFMQYTLKDRKKSVKKLKSPFVLATINCLGCKEFARIHGIEISAYVTNLESGLKMLQMGRADTIISASILMKKIVNSDKFVTLSNLKFTPKIYHFISKEKIHLKEKLTSEILKSKRRGVFDVNKLRYKK